jgi:hypothetical protein
VATDTTNTILVLLILPYLGWLGLKVIQTSRDVARLKVETDTKIAAIQQRCTEHHEWMGKLDTKTDRMESKLDRVLGHMERK